MPYTVSVYSIVLHFLVTPSIGLSGLRRAIGFVTCTPNKLEQCLCLCVDVHECDCVERGKL